MASVPDTSGVIHACYKTGLLNNGQVRIIDSATQSCNANETAISFNSATPGQFLTNLVGADFSGADLRNRNFSGADLHASDFTNANLGGSSFKGANFTQAVFGNSDIQSHLYAKDTTFDSANFSSVHFGGEFDFTGATFASANLSNNDFHSSTIQGGDFRTSNLQNTQLDAYFYNSDFAGVNFSGVGASGANLSNASFSHANGVLYLNFSPNPTTSTNVDGANFTGNKITDSNWAGIDFSHTTLTNVTWDNVICPDQTNSGNTCIGHLVP